MELSTKIFSIDKTDAARQLVFGFASIIEDADGRALVDHQGDIIGETELETAAYNFVMHSRTGAVEHTTKIVGVLVESFVITSEKRKLLNITMPLGWWIGFKINDPNVWARVMSGELKMFSIGGRAKRIRPTRGDL